MRWHLSHRADKRALPIADRHYNRQKIGSPQFVPPGRCLVLLTERADALWVTSYPEAKYVQHAWAGAWMCSCFRNESNYLSSQLITEAVAATRWYASTDPDWGDIPALGFITFVNKGKVRSDNPGYCYKMAGWKHVGYTQGKLVALQLLPEQMPEPAMPWGVNYSLFEEVSA